MPSELSAEDLADTVEEAEDQLQEEASRSRRPARTFEDLSQAPLRSSALSDQDVAALKEGFPFLADFSDDFIRHTPRGDLMKIQSTAHKMREAENGKDADDKLAHNKSSLPSKFTTVPAAKDNRWNQLHDGRFLGGAACSAGKLWLAARAVKEGGHPAIGSYDMGAVGLAGHVSSRGWLELHNPQSCRISIKQFNINNCATRAAPKSASVHDNFADEILDIGEFQLALRAMRVAFHFAMPWNFSIVALEGFFYMSNFCKADLANVEKKAHILTQFTDYILVQNCERWRDAEPFLTTGDIKTAWGAFFHSRPQAAMADKQKAKPKVERSPRLNVCWAYNGNACPKAAGSCVSAKGQPLRHVCNYVKPGAKPTEICGKDHPKLGNH